ncbi:Bacillibactin exporter [Mucisphaera calidilacus]|uniref:Bacillibactin exporter n=2 Tax=Mucisphaera calidilacus TaxID=2527982 RepID=A0A518BTZ5_9BACT|nr:Bacillibactin exporter [Mucisphaera calidilacus]
MHIPRHAAWTLLAASSLTVMSGATIAPALPAIRDAYADAWQAELMVKLVLTLPALLIALIAPMGGFLLGRFGRKPVLLMGLLLYALAGSSGGWMPASWTIYAMLVGRALLGVAVALIMVSATTLIGDYFSGERRRGVLGLQSAFMAGGGVLFLLLGGVLADADWRLPFGIYLLSVLILPTAWSLPEPPRNESDRSTDATSLAAATPIFLIALGLMVVFYLVPTQLPFLLESVLTEQAGAGGLLSGGAIAASTAAGVVTGLTYARLRRPLGLHGVNTCACALMASGFALVWLAPMLESGWGAAYALLVLGMGVYGLGSGILMPNLNNWLLDVVPERSRGRAVGMLTAAFFLGQFLSPIVTAPAIGTVGIAGSFGLASLLLMACAMSSAFFVPGIRHALSVRQCAYQDPLGPCPGMDRDSDRLEPRVPTRR